MVLWSALINEVPTSVSYGVVSNPSSLAVPLSLAFFLFVVAVSLWPVHAGTKKQRRTSFAPAHDSPPWHRHSFASPGESGVGGTLMSVSILRPFSSPSCFHECTLPPGKSKRTHSNTKIQESPLCYNLESLPNRRS